MKFNITLPYSEATLEQLLKELKTVNTAIEKECAERMARGKSKGYRLGYLKEKATALHAEIETVEKKQAESLKALNVSLDKIKEDFNNHSQGPIGEAVNKEKIHEWFFKVLDPKLLPEGKISIIRTRHYDKNFDKNNEG